MAQKKDWTLMFFFASDNTLSPSMLYQLKAIKTAGYELNTNVLVHFDPHERGIPSMIFEVNKLEKQGQDKSRIGDAENPTVRDLAGDQIEPKINGDNCTCNGSSDYDNLPADQALTHFLEVTRKEYPAKKYMLFLVGHGLVVGRDAFLPDDNPRSGISLVELGKILRKFKREISATGGELELIGMHSCSMSAVEVAYQLKGTANYMMASEGLSFVGAWPYRQMLQKIFCAIKHAKDKTEIKIPDLMKNLYELCLHNGADFIFAGFSSDLCLCSLEPQRVEALSAPIEKLSKALQAGLTCGRGKELIMLAHWKAQSYFQEVYTDLYDFCLCLHESCSDADNNTIQQDMKDACDEVIKVLTPNERKPIGPIMYADFFGPDCQYSHGLSIYFPWARPVEDASEHVIKNYRSYAFVTELCGASWLEFLDAYFEKTLRPKREVEPSLGLSFDRKAALKFATARFRPFASRTGQAQMPIQALTGGKTSPADASGDFSYTVIKNYSRDFAISDRALKVFANEKGKKKRST